MTVCVTCRTSAWPCRRYRHCLAAVERSPSAASHPWLVARLVSLSSSQLRCPSHYTMLTRRFLNIRLDNIHVEDPERHPHLVSVDWLGVPPQAGDSLTLLTSSYFPSPILPPVSRSPCLPSLSASFALFCNLLSWRWLYSRSPLPPP